MLRKGTVNYPKRKEKTNLEDTIIKEPVRETMYDIMMRNFKIANRVTFIHRLIYMGEHSLMRDTDELAQRMSDVIDQVNEEYHLETLSGFLLVYSKCFIHMVEGDEDSIHKHLKLLLENPDFLENVGTMKVLICVHHINQRFQEGWSSYTGVPSKLFEQIDENSTLEDTGRHIYNCIKKMYNLVYQYVSNKNEPALSIEETPRSSTEGDIYSYREIRDGSNYYPATSLNRGKPLSVSHSSMRSASIILAGTLSIDPYRNTLPEYEIVKFLINSNFTQTLQSYYELYRLVPQRDIYKDKVWPIPSDFVPYDVFTKPYDTITELPRERTEDFHSRVLPTKGEVQQEQKDEDASTN